MQQVIPNEYFWAVVYTRSRSEKKLHDKLGEQQIESYLPLRKVLRQWSDRKKWVEEPLFGSYLFVRVSEKERFKVLNTPGAVGYVSFEGTIARVREEEITVIRRLTACELELEAVTDRIEEGTPICIRAGSLIGLRGELVAYRSTQRVVVRIESIQQHIIVSVPSDWVVPLISPAA